MKKKVISLLLAASMVLSLAACGNNDNVEESSSDSANVESSTDVESSDSTEEAADTYTYAYSDAASSTWSPTDWETSDESSVLALVTMGLYDFWIGDDGTGYKVVPEMATEMPVDVTAEFAGNEVYGVPADAAEGYAWRITLNPDACWEDGTPITSADYVYSMQQFLNPDMANYRASLYYTGQLTLANAYGYYNSNNAGEMGYSSSIGSLGYATVGEAQDAGYTEFGIDLANFWGMGNAGTVSITDETMYRDEAVAEGEAEDYVSGKYMWDTYFAPGMPYESYSADYIYVGEVIEGNTWEEVGLIADDDYTITLVLERPISEFYLAYNLSSSWLVHEDTYEANKQQTGDLIKSSYGTSVETTVSHGPYKIVEFQADKYMKLTKNENWYGYKDGKHEGQFQTTDVYIQYIDEHTTEMSLFLQGELSTVGLDSTDIETYGTSDYLYYAPQTYTSKFSFNGDYEMLSQNDGNGVNHSILSIKDFRKAISLCLDRDAFCASCTAGHEPGFGLLNYNYTAIPETGELYRDFDAAKQALCNVYEADDVNDITGYDKEQATQLFQAAYNEAVSTGIMNADDKVELNFHLYGTDEGYVRIVNFLQESINAATVGTSLEGKVTVNHVGDENYYDNMEAGTVDIAITTWGGASMDPYSMMECYCDPGTKNEYSFDPENETWTINVDGEEITKTFYDWYVALCGGEYATADYDTKIQILAGMEEGLLETYLMIPVYYRNSSVLYSQRTVLGSETYLNTLLGFGGIRYMTYTMNDAEWEAYCAENNNQLTY